MATAGGAVHDQDGVGDFAGVVFDGLAEGGIVNVQLRKAGLTALKGKFLIL